MSTRRSAALVLCSLWKLLSCASRSQLDARPLFHQWNHPGLQYVYDLQAAEDEALPLDGRVRQLATGARVAGLPPAFQVNRDAFLLEMPSGELLCAWSSAPSLPDATHDAAEAEAAVVLARLPPGAHRWSSPQMVSQEKGFTHTLPTLFVDSASGSLHLVHDARPAGRSGRGDGLVRGGQERQKVSQPEEPGQGAEAREAKLREEPGFARPSQQPREGPPQAGERLPQISHEPVTHGISHSQDPPQHVQREELPLGSSTGPALERLGRVMQLVSAAEHEGIFWGEPVGTQTAPGSLMGSRVVQLRDGSLLLPRHTSLEGTQRSEANSGMLASDPSRVDSIVWKSGTVIFPNTSGLMQPRLVRLKNQPGMLKAFFLNVASHTLYSSMSDDEAITWTVPHALSLPPVQADAFYQVTTLASNALVMVFAPCFAPEVCVLSAALSYDDGHTWPYMRHLDHGERHLAGGGASGSVVQTADGRIHVALSARGGGIVHVCFIESWLKAAWSPASDRSSGTSLENLDSKPGGLRVGAGGGVGVPFFALQKMRGGTDWRRSDASLEVVKACEASPRTGPIVDGVLRSVGAGRVEAHLPSSASRIDPGSPVLELGPASTVRLAWVETDPAEQRSTVVSLWMEEGGVEWSTMAETAATGLPGMLIRDLVLYTSPTSSDESMYLMYSQGTGVRNASASLAGNFVTKSLNTGATWSAPMKMVFDTEDDVAVSICGHRVIESLDGGPLLPVCHHAIPGNSSSISIMLATTVAPGNDPTAAWTVLRAIPSGRYSQPVLLRSFTSRNHLAMMVFEEGARRFVRVDRSPDDLWSQMTPVALPLPKSNGWMGATALNSGNVAVVYQVSAHEKSWHCRVVIFLSDDEGWNFRYHRTLERRTGSQERQANGIPSNDFAEASRNDSEHQGCEHEWGKPCIVQSPDGIIHVAYAAPRLNSFKYTQVTEKWIRAGDEK
eukprot:CAMPEP_0114250288 /NCGR_PEP_ID=MMETSP0058-20121206/14616_1 /TAXON_ID=36894 /ORGANISM="Pyramimonas parkeae, CCMP726" /LENGTH=954 /DNA_ID=CAMNT_0001363931 /DNA_START=533 /DNA_END=3397 /DNA_ORIENTATION=-